ncbi:MAG: ABC-F family ATP-binding cassette domain-containing protein [Flavobacteriales bacterium]|nr:ABC-F family ATP-binding cassette domain-containing protein [Flavobacteriales bacterium]
MEGIINYLSVEGVSRRFGERLIFEDITFGVNKGQKVALVARNGTGKTTLLKILTGEDTPDTGSVTYNNDVKLAYLAQEHGLKEELSILGNLFDADNEMVKAIRVYEELLLNEAEADQDALQKAINRMDQMNAWNYEANAKQILGKLNIHDLNMQVSTMSGGEKRRVALAKALIAQPDMLLLDEPTNHLDLDMIEWLEDYLARTNMTLLMVTHDRYFLEVVCDEILEIDDMKIYRYKGNFSYFLEKKAEREELEFVNREKARNLMRRELQWVRTQPKARTTKSKARLGAFKDLKKAAHVRLEEDELKLQLNPHRLGGKIVELHRLKKQFGEKKLIDGYDYMFRKGEKMGIVGPNGSGKSTFLNMLTGSEEVDGGKVVIGETVVFGYYTQKGIKFKEGQRVVEAIKEIAEVIPLKGGAKISAAQMLERFLFPRSMHHQYISKLSGGERKRLYLLTILMANPNFLILDEPTNDLDIFTLSVLEDYLQDFPGCLVIVSHDRYFMDKLVEHVLLFGNEGKIRDIPGNYSAYRAKISEEERQAKALNKEIKAAQPKVVKKETTDSGDKPKKLSYKEKYELEQITKRLEELEVLKAGLEEKLNDPSLDHEKLSAVSAELGEVMSELDEKEMRWLELSEIA